MSFELDNGYIPASIETIISDIRVGINNEFGTDYTPENFVGTNWYKFTYAISQKVSQGEIKTSEVFQKLKEYIEITNQSIQRPVSTFQGIIDRFLVDGYLASVKKQVVEDAGKVSICVDVTGVETDYAAKKLQICNIIKDTVSLGMITQGDQVEAIVLSNGQSFDWKFYLPDRIVTKLRLTITTSENNQYLIGDPEVTKQKLLTNIANRYALGKNFEPQRYFMQSDAPWSSAILLEYSIDDGETWSSAIFNADFDELLEVALARTELVES
jgi:hypothetical protein